MNEKIKRPLRVIFMGTSSFAVQPLRALYETEDVILVVTPPDRRSGRGLTFMASPVREEAHRQGIHSIQPGKIRDPEAVLALSKASCDLIVVTAYGQILPPEVLEIPPLGCINIHASLLPKYRGASPITTAIVRGEKVTGVTTMMMDQGMDTGDILMQMSLEIQDSETAEELSERLSVLGSRSILKTLKSLKEGKLERAPQSEADATYTPLLTKKHGEIDWNQVPVQIRNHVRGMNPWPGAYTLFQGKSLKIWRVTPHEENDGPGRVLHAKERLIVAVKDGSVIIDELQLPGKKRVSGTEFLRGHHEIREGMILGR